MTFDRSSSDTFELLKSLWREANDLPRYAPIPIDVLLVRLFFPRRMDRTNWSGVRNVIILSTPIRIIYSAFSVTPRVIKGLNIVELFRGILFKRKEGISFFHVTYVLSVDTFARRIIDTCRKIIVQCAENARHVIWASHLGYLAAEGRS